MRRKSRPVATIPNTIISIWTSCWVTIDCVATMSSACWDRDRVHPTPKNWKVMRKKPQIHLVYSMNRLVDWKIFSLGSLPDAIATNCSKCTEKQRTGSEKVTHYLIDHQPDEWDQLAVIYDKDGEYKRSYLESKATEETDGNDATTHMDNNEMPSDESEKSEEHKTEWCKLARAWPNANAKTWYNLECGPMISKQTEKLQFVHLVSLRRFFFLKIKIVVFQRIYIYKLCKYMKFVLNIAAIFKSHQMNKAIYWIYLKLFFMFIGIISIWTDGEHFLKQQTESVPILTICQYPMHTRLTHKRSFILAIEWSLSFIPSSG